MVRSKNILTKQLQITGLDVIIPPEEVFETFVKADDLTMSTKCYLAS